MPMQMNARAYYILSAFIFFIFSCSGRKGPAPGPDEKSSIENETEQHFLINSTGDTIPTGVPIPAKGQRIDPDKVAKPKAIPIQGQPNTVPAHPNILPAGAPKVVPLPDSLPVITPGKDNIPLPNIIPAIGKAGPAFHPQPVPASMLRMREGAVGNLQYLNKDQGMNSYRVRSIVEDRRGNLWIATWGGGVSRYDGVSFSHFTTDEGLSSNDARFILEDSRGELWFATWESGVSRYNGDNFIHYTTDGGLVDNSVLSILEDSKGNIWFGTYGGASRYDGANFTNFTTKEGLSFNGVWAMLEDRQGNLWFGTTGGGVNRYDGKSFTHYTSSEGLSHDVLRSIFEDSQGNLWFGTYGGGVNRYDGKSFAQYTASEGLSHDFVLSIHEDKQGNLWFGTSGGVSRYDGKSFQNYRTEEGLSSNIVTSILEDTPGNLWFGTFNGISWYNYNSFAHYLQEDGLSNNWVYSILESHQGNLWLGTSGNGVSRYDGTNYTNYTTQEGLSLNYVRCILEDSKKNLWFGTFGNGANKFDGESFTHYTSQEGLCCDQVMSILEDCEGNMWFGTSGGLTRYDGTSFTHYTIGEGLSANEIMDILEDGQGDLWFATWGGGVSRYDGTNFTHYTTQEGLSNNFVTSMLEDSRGHLWFATWGGGMNQYDGTSFVHYTTKEGLSNNKASSILEDDKNNIWASTADGITLLAPRGTSQGAGSSASVAYQFFAFDKADGMKRTDFEFNSACLDHSGRIWWGSVAGAAMLDLKQFELPATAPKVQLNTIEIAQAFIDYRRLRDTTYRNTLSFGKRLSRSFESVVPFYNYPATMALPSKLNHLTFHFSAIDWRAPHKLRYSYQMEGLDADWSPFRSEPKADYRNIPYGSYAFKVKAVGIAGMESEPLVYHFSILPPWYHTWWARAVWIGLALGIIYWIYRFQLKRKLEQAEALRAKEIQKKNEQLKETLGHLQTTQQQLIQQEKMASLGQMTAGIAHEIKNPLNFVNNLSELSVELADELKEELERYQQSKAPEDYEILLEVLQGLQKNAQLIQDNGQRANGIVSSMMDHANDNQGERRKTDLNALVEEHLRLAYHGYKGERQDFVVAFEKDLDSSLPPVTINPQEIGRVLINLFNNACYAVEEKAKTAEEGYHPTIRVSTRQVDGQVEIRIRDNGPGIPANIRDKIFNPFYTTKPTGKGSTGLGLSISYDIVVQGHQGRLWCEGKEGEGAAFMVSLPVT